MEGLNAVLLEKSLSLVLWIRRFRDSSKCAPDMRERLHWLHEQTNLFD